MTMPMSKFISMAMLLVMSTMRSKGTYDTYVCTAIRIYAPMHAGMHVCMSYVRTYVRTCVGMHVCMYVCMYVCIHVSMRLYMYR